MSSQQIPDICFDSLLSFEIDNEAECRKQFKRQLTIVVPAVIWMRRVGEKKKSDLLGNWFRRYCTSRRGNYRAVHVILPEPYCTTTRREKLQSSTWYSTRPTTTKKWRGYWFSSTAPFHSEIINICVQIYHSIVLVRERTFPLRDY